MKAFALLFVLGVPAICQDQTAIQVKPATPVIQNKDLWERTGLVPPFRRMPRFAVRD